MSLMENEYAYNYININVVCGTLNYASDKNQYRKKSKLTEVQIRINTNKCANSTSP